MKSNPKLGHSSVLKITLGGGLHVGDDEAFTLYTVPVPLSLEVSDMCTVHLCKPRDLVNRGCFYFYLRFILFIIYYIRYNINIAVRERVKFDHHFAFLIIFLKIIELFS